MTRTEAERVERAIEELQSTGMALLPGGGETSFRALAAALGDVVQTTQVVVRPESRALVTSSRGLDVHTDHHGVDFIVWLCHAPAHCGGESVVVDARGPWARLDARCRAALHRVVLREHRVFEDDREKHPLVELRGGVPCFYYSFWLVDELLDPDLRDAYDAFRAAIACAPRWVHRLASGDVLAIDNRRVLHGRTPIRDQSSPRHLERLWIRTRRGSACQPIKKGNDAC